MRWGPDKAARPTFTLEEMKRIVETARLAGVRVSAHATSKEGMRLAAIAGVATIEHGYEGDVEVFRLMAKNDVALTRPSARRYCVVVSTGKVVTPAWFPDVLTYSVCHDAGCVVMGPFISLVFPGR